MTPCVKEFFNEAITRGTTSLQDNATFSLAIETTTEGTVSNSGSSHEDLVAR